MLESVCKTDRNSAASGNIDRAQHARVMRKRHRGVAPAWYRQRERGHGARRGNPRPASVGRAVERPVRRGRRQFGAGGEIDETISFVVVRDDLEERDGAQQRLHRSVVLARELMDLAGALSLRTRVITAPLGRQEPLACRGAGSAVPSRRSAVPTAAARSGETARGPGAPAARARLQTTSPREIVTPATHGAPCPRRACSRRRDAAWRW